MENLDPWPPPHPSVVCISRAVVVPKRYTLTILLSTVENFCLILTIPKLIFGSHPSGPKGAKAAQTVENVILNGKVSVNSSIPLTENKREKRKDK